MIVDVLCIVGFHWVLKYGSILNIPRREICKIKFFKKLFECSLCLGTWCGLIYGLYTSKDPIVYAFVGSSSCWLFDNISNVLQRVDIKLEK